MTRKIMAVAAAGLMVAATPAPTQMEWNVDGAHTEVNFEVRHFFTPVTGEFDVFDVELFFDPADPSTARVDAVIQVASIDTSNSDRDAHLRSPDFFAAERFPAITFSSDDVREVGENRYVATGELTIRDVTRTIELPITLLGVQEIPAEMRQMTGGAAQVASFEAELELDRRDFEVGTGSWAETAIVGSDVKVTLLLEASR